MPAFSYLNRDGAKPLRVAAAKTGDRVMGEYLQHLIREWLAAKPARTEAEFSRLSGLSRGNINIVKNRAEGAGRTTVEGFARALKRNAGDLYRDGERWHAAQHGGPVLERDPGTLGPRFGDLPGWAEAEAEARARFSDIPAYAFERAASSSGAAPPDRIDAITVAGLARWWLDSTSRQERLDAEREEVVRAIEERKRLARRKETPAPPSAKPISSRPGKKAAI